MREYGNPEAHSEQYEEGFQSAKQIQADAVAQKKPAKEMENYVYPEAVRFILTMNREMLSPDEIEYLEGYLSAWD